MALRPDRLECTQAAPQLRQSAGRTSPHARTVPAHRRRTGQGFDLRHAVRFGGLPTECVEDDAADYLASYVSTYLQHELQQEGITRNLGAFARFLEAASFRQASVLHVAAVARECGIERKTVENWFSALEDLLLAVCLPMFQRRARRALTKHPRLLLFDAGVYRTLRPRGPLDSEAESDGPALETVVLNELRATNAYWKCGYELSTRRTAAGEEVDLVLYGDRGLHAIEAKRSSTVRREDLARLAMFGVDYASAGRWLL